MATFVSTVRFTAQGLSNIAQTQQRAADFTAAAEAMGVKIRDIFWTLGAFDGLVLFDAPDEETATAAMLRLSVGGNVKTQTCRAFNAEEIGTVLEKMA